MNLNKLLCKVFDVDKKGYVTLGDIVVVTVVFAITTALALIVAGFLLVSIYVGGMDIITNGEYDHYNSPFSILGFWVIIFGSAILFVIGAPFVVAQLHKIKVAKCQTKERE